MKKFLKFAFVAILVAVAGYGVYASQKSDTVSDLMLANVEACYKLLLCIRGVVWRNRYCKKLCWLRMGLFRFFL